MTVPTEISISEERKTVSEIKSIFEKEKTKVTEKEKGGQKINKLKEKFQKEEDSEAELKIYVKKQRKKVANEKEKQWYEELRRNRTEKNRSWTDRK